MVDELMAIERRAEAASGSSWRLTEDDRGLPQITIQLADGRTEMMSVQRDGVPTRLEDVEFIAHSREDVFLLLSSLREAQSVSGQQLASVEARVAVASPGPWTAFLESSGGVGGTSVIRISESDDEPDMYLWKGGVLAPDADFDFVAHARQDIPRLIELVRSSS